MRSTRSRHKRGNKLYEAHVDARHRDTMAEPQTIYRIRAANMQDAKIKALASFERRHASPRWNVYAVDLEDTETGEEKTLDVDYLAPAVGWQTYKSKDWKKVQEELRKK